MKITDARAIQTGEKELMDAIIRDLDWGVIEEILKTKYNLTLGSGPMEFRQGDLVVHQNQVAYKLDFDVKVTLSVMVDRRGESFDVVTSVTGEKNQEADAPARAAATAPSEKPTGGRLPEELRPAPAAAPAGESFFMTPDTDISQMASQIADMIADINRS